MKKEGQIRIPSGCAIAGVISKDGKRMNGQCIIDGMKVMHDRSNGLGGGFAAYGIYPEHKNEYALHLFYDNQACKKACEDYLQDCFHIVKAEPIPTKEIPSITDVPIIFRYFVSMRPSYHPNESFDEKEYVVKTIMKINTEMSGCYVFSCGKNMGVFKGVGYPEDIGAFYRLDEYEAYCWTGHGRYPTNTPGWWGGAHPFALLDYSVVHNGEISSYDANRRFIEMFGYKCNLQTDTEVITYIFDYLLRKQKLTLKESAATVAAPFWNIIKDYEPCKQEEYAYLRTVFSSLLITGPFSIILAFDKGLMALNDRLKLRSMVVAEKDDKVYIASEEAAIRTMEPNVEHIFAPGGGEPVIVKVKETN